MRGIGLCRMLLAVAAASTAAGRAGAKEPVAGFARQPEAAVERGQVQIRFRAARATDAAVSIRKDGRIVRHLAAGVLGEGGPAPLHPGLAQALTWDGRDDAGRKVDPAGCTVHVGLGLGARFDRVLGWRGEAVGPVCGLAVDGAGRLFVLSSAYKKPTRMCVLSRDGKYLRCILPYPADLAEEKVRGVDRLELSDGRRVPIVRNPISFALYPDLYGSVPAGGLPAQTMLVVGERVVFTNAWNFKYAAQGSPRRLLTVGTDGSVPGDFLGPLLTGGRSCGFAHLAPAGDGRSVFVAGLGEGGYKMTRPLHAVYRVALTGEGPGRVHLGDPATAGRDEKHFNEPRGLAVDARGNLYVSDSGNDRIAVFGGAGRFLGEVPVEAPGALAVHPRTREMYVLSGRKQFPGLAKELLKLSAVVGADGKWTGGGRVVDRLKWDYSRLVFAVDGGADPTVVWIGGWLSKTGRFLHRMEEADGRFGKLRPVLPAGEPALVYGGFLGVDRAREEVYTQTLGGPGDWGCTRTWLRIDGRTGRTTSTKVPGVNIAFGPDGHLYVLGGKNYLKVQLLRVDRDGRPVPFGATGTHVLAEGSFQGGDISIQHGPAGHCVGPDGEVYVLYPDPQRKSKRTVVDVYGPEGKRRKKELILAGPDAEGIKVDARGCIYLADTVKPADSVYPPELTGRVPKSRNWAHGVNWYSWYGSVLKFPPTGGQVWGETGRPHTSLWGFRQAKVDGAKWVRTGIYPMPGGAAYLGCTCFGPRFDVDGFGRVFLPDAAACCVRVLDSDGRAITRFGDYGNMDSRGPGGPVARPEIAFAWPQYVAVSDEAAYVSDVMNRRVVRVRLTYSAERSVPIERP